MRQAGAIQTRLKRPELGSVIKMDEMRDFMGYHVSTDLGWGEDQTPAEANLPL